MRKTTKWHCHFEGCKEIPQHFRRYKGKLLHLCTHHNVMLHNQRLGKPIDYSDLSNKDWVLLENLEFKDK